MPKITIFWPKMYISGDTFKFYKTFDFTYNLSKCHQICTFWAK